MIEQTMVESVNAATPRGAVKFETRALRGSWVPRSIAAGSGGFSLVEALVALVVGGLVISAALALMLGQNRFHRRMGDQIWAEQTLRATTDLMTSELRMASPDDLLAAEADSVSFRFDTGRAIVCDSAVADRVNLVHFDSVAAWGLDPRFAGTAYSKPRVPGFVYADGFVPTSEATGVEPREECVANGAPTSLPDDSFVTTGGWGSVFTGNPPERGGLVRFYGRLTYRFARSTFLPDLDALWRGSQELAGPFATGAAFSFVLDDGSVRSRLDGADIRLVRSVRVTARVVGQNGERFGVRRDLAFQIRLHN